MEANGLVPTPSGLLSLRGGVEELLLSHLSRGEGGLQGLLNLRLVCSTTKEWVDDLPLHQGRRLFANCQAQVDLTEEGSLERFLEAPPPSHVTSLLLKGVDSDFVPKRESWNLFVQLWSPRLKSLHLDELSLPINYRLGEIVGSTSIRRLRCEKISCRGPADVPDFLVELEELEANVETTYGVNEYGMTDSQIKAIVLILGSVKRLVIPNWSIVGGWDLQVAADILRIRNSGVNSQLTFKFDDSCYVADRDEEYPENFVGAVVTSHSFNSIRVQKVGEKFLRQVGARVEEEEALKFFRCVESIEFWKNPDPDDDEPLFLTNFPNLKRLKCVNGNVRTPIEFPRSLKLLKILNGLPARAILSPYLTSLKLCNLNCSAVELARSLNLIDESCRRLESLEMFWNSASKGAKEKKKEEVGGASQEDARFFPHLRSLCIHLPRTDTIKVEDLFCWKDSDSLDCRSLRCAWNSLIGHKHRLCFSSTLRC